MNTDQVRQQILDCTRCALHRVSSCPVPWSGPLSASVAVLGEAPGEVEDQSGEPFVGPSGQLLRKTLTKVGFDVAELAFMNVVCCYPARTPREEEVAACRPNLTGQLRVVAPRWVLVVGGIALRALGQDERISAVRGEPWDRSLKDGGVRTYFPVFHPAAVLRNRALYGGWCRDLEDFRRLTGA